VITRADIVERVAEWQLTEEVIEKDYVLGWLLWGIGTDPVLGTQWVFKGGTCLKKCYIETYRFSEDLDFTVLPGWPTSARGGWTFTEWRAGARARRVRYRLLRANAGPAASTR